MEDGIVVVGLPVFNGEKSLRRALESLVAQTYKNLMILIVDNCSTDETTSIIQEFKTKYPNVIEHKNASNIGMIGNFNLALSLANTYSPTYFMWASHDDYYEKDFVFELTNLLKRDSEVVLATSYCASITDGIVNFIDSGSKIDSDDVYDRFSNYRTLLHKSGYVGCLFYGIIRFEALKKVKPLFNVICSDHFPLFELLLKGKFKILNKVLFYKSGGGASRDLASLKRLIGVKSFFHNSFPYLGREYLIFQIVKESKNLGFYQKSLCIIQSFVCYLKYSILRDNYRSFKHRFKTELLEKL